MSEQRSRLAIEIDSSQAVRDAKAVTKELELIQKTGDFAAKSVEGTSKSINQFSQEGSKGAASAKVLAGQIGSVGTNSKATTDSLSKVSQNTVAATGVMNTASKAAQVLASRIMAIATVGSAISRADSWVQMAAQIENAAGSIEKYDMIQKHLLETANTTYRPLKEAQQVYLDVGTALEALGNSTERALRITDSLSFSYTHNATAADKAANATNAFKSTIYSQKVSNQNWLSILSAIPSIVDDLNRSTGLAKAKILQLGNAGEITSKQLNDALDSNREHSEELANNMSNSLTDGLTVLANAVDTYLGNLNRSSGATNTLASQLGVLAENIDLVISVAAVAGIGYLTKTILSQTTATYGSITALMAKRAALIAEQQEAVKSAAATVSVARANLANVQAANAETAAMRGQNVAAKELAVSKASLAAAENTLSSAQGTLVKSTSLLSRGFGLIGGPIGAITVAVTGLSALYTHFRAKTEEANQKLTEQAKVANKTAEELKKLEGVERAAAKTDLADSFADQNLKLLDLNDQFNKFVGSLSNAHGSSAEYVSIASQVERGMISQEDALGRLNKLEYLTPEQRKQALEIINNYEVAREKAQKNADAQRILGKEVELVGNKSSNAVGKNNDLANSHYRVSAGADAETESLKKLRNERLQLIQQSSAEIIKANELWIRTTKLNNDEGKYADFMNNFKSRNKLPVSEILPKEFEEQAHREYKSMLAKEKLQEQIAKRAQDQAKAERERTSEIDKQNKLLAQGNRLVGISGDTGIGNAHVHLQYGGIKKGQRPTAEHMNRIQAGGRSLQSYGISSDVGPRNTGIKGASTNHRGIDFKVPKGKALTTNVAVKDVKTWLDKKGGGYVSTIIFEDGVILEILHQSPDITKKVKGGSSSGLASSRSLSAQESYERKTEHEIHALKADYFSIAEKDAATHQKRLEDLQSHGLNNLIEKEKERYEKTKQLRELEQSLEIDGWRWVGETKVNNDAAVNKLRIEASMDFNAKDKAAAIKSLEEQRDYEISAYRRLQQEKMKEFRSTIEQQTAEYQRMYYDALARASMSQPVFNRWETQNSYSDQMGAAWDNKQNAINTANEKDSKTDQYLNDVETRNQMLIDAEQNYQAAILAIKQKGLLDEAALRQQQYSDNLSVYGAMFGGMADLMKGYVGESSGVYKTLFFMQKSFALAQAGMNVYKAASDAYANEPGTIWQKIGAATLATVESGALLTLIQAATPQGFATGGLFTGDGHVRGAGTDTSDSINAKLSDYEYVIKAASVRKLGPDILNYINRTGELPYQKFQEQLLLRQGDSKQLAQEFGSGGLVGSQKSSPMVERQRLIAVRESKAIGGEGEPNISIHQSITFEASNGEAQINTSGQKAIAESLNGAMNNWARRESMQGGVLFNAIKRIR